MHGLPTLPPLFVGERAARPFETACARAASGAEAGLLLWEAEESLDAALVLIPEVPLSASMAMLPVGAVGLRDAFGAIGPPELPIHLEWEGGLRVNGARCGHLRLATDARDPDAVPLWLVLGLSVPFSRADGEADPGRTPDRTVLLEEGCGDLTPVQLLEAWARHTLLWINRWTDEGAGPVHRGWEEASWEKGRTLSLRGRTGTFLGLDEGLGALIRGAATEIVPLTELLDPLTGDAT